MYYFIAFILSIHCLYFHLFLLITTVVSFTCIYPFSSCLSISTTILDFTIIVILTVITLSLLRDFPVHSNEFIKFDNLKTKLCFRKVKISPLKSLVDGIK